MEPNISKTGEDAA